MAALTFGQLEKLELRHPFLFECQQFELTDYIMFQ